MNIASISILTLTSLPICKTNPPLVYMVTDQLEKKVRELYKKVCDLEEEKYDWEEKLRRQTYEVSDLLVSETNSEYSGPYSIQPFYFLYIFV